MIKQRPPTLIQLLRHMNTRFEEQLAETKKLQALIDVQFKRIAAIQAELDVLPIAQQRRNTIRALLQPLISAQPHNGTGHRARRVERALTGKRA
jgi:hypothetical protein